MGFGNTLVVITFFVVFVAFMYEVAIKETPAFPEVFFKDHYWGRNIIKDGEPIPKDSPEIRKFVVKIEDSAIEDLKQQLKRTRYVEPPPNTNFTYGFNGAQLKKVVDYWVQKYDWKKEEKELNKHNHFKTQIEGIDVHFIHVKPAKAAKHTFPLMLVHGYPGTFVEYLKLIPLLTNVENEVAFELIIPSIPGYGFSEIPHKPDFGVLHCARVFNKLMTKLGYKKFYYHGGDWGAVIGRYIAAMYPENVLGFHTNIFATLRFSLLDSLKYAMTYFIPSVFSDNPEAEVKLLRPFKEKLFFDIRESGYLHIQATKPDTIGAALLNTPAGLAAYIMEKFSTWTNRDYVNLGDGGLTKRFTYDELITNVMVYWVTNTIYSSHRFYKEYFSNTYIMYPEIESAVVSVPVGVSIPPNEILYTPKIFAKKICKNLLHYNFLPRGGHFVAFEEPKLIASEIRVFVTKCIDYYNHIEIQKK